MADADVRVKSDTQIITVMACELGYYSERTVFPWVIEDDLEMGLLDVAHDALHANDADYPWVFSLWRRAPSHRLSLWARPADGARLQPRSRRASGKKRTILNAVPFYRTDVVLRRVETDCCDGGLVCRCNLVRAYDEIISFCEKCLRLLRARRGTA